MSGGKVKYTTKLANPYSQPPTWPTISATDTQVIEELLVALLAPIGRYRQQQNEAAALARSRKRKRKSEKHREKEDVKHVQDQHETGGSSQTPNKPGDVKNAENHQPGRHYKSNQAEPEQQAQQTNADKHPPTTPKTTTLQLPDSATTTNADKDSQGTTATLDTNGNSHEKDPPSIDTYILPGFNTLHRHLDLLAAHSAPPPLSRPNTSTSNSNSTTTKTTQTHPAHITAIFIAATNQDSMFAHLPALCTTASLAHPSLPPTRIVPLPDSACRHLGTALGVARLSCLGVLDGAPGSDALVAYVRSRVSETKVGWVEEMVKGVYLPVKVEVVESSLPKTKARKRKKGGGK